MRSVHSAFKSFVSLGIACFAFGVLTSPAAAQITPGPPPTPPTAAQKQAQKSNMDLVGFNDLQNRSAYQPLVEKQGQRWIAYIGHHGGTQLNPLTGQTEVNGTSIVDVTDPKQPKYLAHIPGQPTKSTSADAGGAQMVRVCGGSELPHADKSKFYMLRTNGTESQEMWDVTDPSKPSRINTIVSGLLDTHKNWWECDTGIAYLVVGQPTWRVHRHLEIWDLSDPAKPVFIRDFGLPGQQPGSIGPQPSELHGPFSTGPKGNRVYLAYGQGNNGIIQILDRDKLLNGPKEPTEANLLYPQIARVDFPKEAGAHTAFPVLGMDLAEFAKQRAVKPHDYLIVPGETTGNECQEAMRQMVRILDITEEARPIGVSTYTPTESTGNYCSDGGRFGAHSTNENMTPIYYKRIIFVAEFNAGVRAVDIRDPMHPKEIAYYVPAITDKTDKRCVGRGDQQTCKIAIQTNNVDVDDRGYIYIVDRANTGMHILQLTGPARQVANFSSMMSSAKP